MLGELSAQYESNGDPACISDGYGDPGQVNRPGLTAEDRTEDGRPDLGHLGQEQGKEQGQKMA